MLFFFRLIFFDLATNQKKVYLYYNNCFTIDDILSCYDNVVLRGEGSGKDGTIIYSGSNTLQELENPSISPAVIRTGYKIQPSQEFWSAKMKNPVPI